MKRHFAGIVLALAFVAVALSTLSRAQNPQTPSTKRKNTGIAARADLQLVIEGPFVLCQRKSGIEIALPNLAGNHYPPGFRAENAEYPLDERGQWKYTVYSLQLTHTGSGGMAPHGDGQGVPGDATGGGPATLYRENYSCPTFGDKTGTSLVISVPKPDEILPFGDRAELTTVRNSPPLSPGQVAGTTQGICKSGYCKHANRVVFRYWKTYLDSVTLKCTSCLKPSPNPPWPPKGALVKVGTDAQLFLDLQPVVLAGNGPWPVPTSVPSSCQRLIYDSATIKDPILAMKEEEAEAFCTAAQMANLTRYLFPQKVHGEIPTVHRDCGATPALFLCTGKACR